MVKICAIIVTYYPDPLSLKPLLSSIRSQVDRVVLVDNGSLPDIEEWLGHEHAFDRLTYIKIGSNVGIAAAQNRGIKWACERHFTHFLLLDQDSLPTEDMVEHLVGCLLDLRSKGANVAAVGPWFRDTITGSSSSFTQYGRIKYKHVYCSDQSCMSIEAAYLIASGALISIEAINAVGLMDESLFIDLVDTEWFLRANAKGYSAFGSCSAMMSHRLGVKQIRVWLAGWRDVPYHHPLRHYYYFRNSILIFKRDYVNWTWRKNQLVELVYMFFLFSVTSPPRLHQVRMMLKGITDGLRGISGKYRGNDER